MHHVICRTAHRPTVLLLAALGVALSATLRAQIDITAARYATGFSAPVAIVQDPTNRSVQFVVEKAGRIRVVQNGVVLPSNFLDLSAVVSSQGERGLLGLAFPADHASSGRLYVNFTNAVVAGNPALQGHTVVARFKRSPTNALVADPSTRFDLGWNGATGPRYIVQPFANHNGGHLAFGPDGYLYVGLGDGGGGGDPQHRAQAPTELLGKMLRIDVSVPDNDPVGYRVPLDNPFVSGSPLVARSEIWSFGLRNPWRYSFDPPALGGTGALLVADVGQAAWEEVNYEPAGRGGRNYGWRNREGAHPLDGSLPPAYAPLTDPVHEYSHAVGTSITGGYVYRGRWLPAAYRGRYFFGDFGNGRVWSLAFAIDGAGNAQVTSVIEHTAALNALHGPIGAISSFGLDADGEIFVVSLFSGSIYRIVATAPPSRPTGFRRSIP